MPQGSTTFHESEEHLKPATRDMHRAIVSLMEELEAVDWYQQRMDATESPELRDILRHNRDEEKEHAAMVLEWIRRHDPAFDVKLREYLFTEGSIVGREASCSSGTRGTKARPRSSRRPRAAATARAALAAPRLPWVHCEEVGDGLPAPASRPDI
jgi:ferritin-like protein